MGYRRRADRWRFLVTIVVIASGFGGAGQAGAATQIGETFVPSVSDPGSSLIQTGSPGGQFVVPRAGVITSWSHFAGSGPQTLKLKVARALGANSFTIVGGSFEESTVPNVLNTFSAQVSVRPGDVIGLFATASTPVAASDSSYAYHFALGDPPTDSTAAFLGPFGGRKLDISVTLEPDCDGDTLGDETQDPVVSSECPRDDAVPPNTKILKANTGRRSKFKFATNEPVGATFRCRLDDKKYKPCETPKKIRVGPGSHSFRVFSIDAAGNADPTPARAEWAVQKKR